MYYGVTIVTEWNLFCDRLHLSSITQTVFMIGSFLSLSIGVLSDRFGRKKMSVLMTIFLGVVTLISEIFQSSYFDLSFEAKYIIYLVSQFLVGFFQYSIEITVFVLFIEMANSSYSSAFTIFYLNSFGVGELAILAISYFLRNWHYQNLIIAVYSILVGILIGIFMPESPRYLIAQKCYKKASEVLSRIAKVNGRDPVTIEDIKNEMDMSGVDTSEIMNLTSDNVETTKKLVNRVETSVFNYLCNPKKNMLELLLLAYVWLSIAMCYYGMNYGIHI